MGYKITRLYHDGQQKTEVLNEIPDYCALNHELDKCEIKSFIVSLN